MVECDLDIDLSWQGTLILKYFQSHAQNAYIIGVSQLF